MSLPVLPLNVTTPLTVVANVANDNVLNLTGGKFVFSITASSDVTVGVFGPFPAGIVNPATKTGLGKVKFCGSNVTIGNNAVSAPGSYLFEVTSPTTATVEVLVRPWVWSDNVLQYYWKLTSPSKC